jgi:shikimate dehydrogenase
VSRQLGVIGWPIAHSYSPAMQEAAFAALGLDWRYGAFAVPPERLTDAIRGAGALGFVGLNVTVPHKETALALCDPDGEAGAVGAVNTLVWEEGRLRPRGLNTDLHGFRALLDETVARGLRGDPVVVLGAGGAARAAVMVLHGIGADIAIVTRSGRRVRFPGKPEFAHHPFTAAALSRLLPTARLLVDATPRGLDPDSRLDLGALPPDATVIDLVVRPSTPLVDAARARGLRAATGEAMLAHQGAKALEAWCGRPAPVEVMRAALAAALRRA